MMSFGEQKPPDAKPGREPLIAKELAIEIKKHPSMPGYTITESGIQEGDEPKNIIGLVFIPQKHPSEKTGFRTMTEWEADEDPNNVALLKSQTAVYHALVQLIKLGVRDIYVEGLPIGREGVAKELHAKILDLTKEVRRWAKLRAELVAENEMIGKRAKEAGLTEADRATLARNNRRIETLTRTLRVLKAEIHDTDARLTTGLLAVSELVEHHPEIRLHGVEDTDLNARIRRAAGVGAKSVYDALQKEREELMLNIFRESGNPNGALVLGQAHSLDDRVTDGNKKARAESKPVILLITIKPPGSK